MEVIEDRDNTNLPLRRYVCGRGIDQPVLMEDAGNLEKYYYHANALGSAALLTDNSGAVVERYENDTYGTSTAFDFNFANPGPESLFGNPYRFTSRHFDGESGLYYYRARHYHPTQGRFLQRDPIGYGDESSLMNLYCYSSNNPANFSDPYGEEDIYVRGSQAYWVVEREKAWNETQDPDIAEIPIGDVKNGMIQLRTYYGGISISVEEATRIAHSHAYMDQLGKSVRAFAIHRAFTQGITNKNIIISAREAFKEGYVEGSGHAKEIISEAVSENISVISVGMINIGYEASDAAKANDAYKIAKVSAHISIAATEAAVAVLASGYNTKIMSHGPHHSFKALGGRKMSHIQIQFFKKGVKGSGKAFRIPIPNFAQGSLEKVIKILDYPILP